MYYVCRVCVGLWGSGDDPSSEVPSLDIARGRARGARCVYGIIVLGTAPCSTVHRVRELTGAPAQAGISGGR